MRDPPLLEVYKDRMRKTEALSSEIKVGRYQLQTEIVKKIR